MKIINFSVNNYKGINGGLSKNTINFEGSNTIFILGQNNAGKSSILKAYEVFYEDKKLDIDYFFKKNTTNNIEMILEVELTTQEIDEFEDKKDNAIEKYFYGENSNRLKLKKIWDKEDVASKNLTLLNTTGGDFETVGYAGVGAHNFFKTRLPKPIFIKAMPNEADLEGIVNDLLTSKVKEVLKDKELEEYKDAERTIQALQRKIYDNEEISNYKELVNDHFSTMFEGIKISISEKEAESVIKSIDKKFKINFDHFDETGVLKDDLPNSFENIGHGAIRIALFTLFLMRDISGTIENNTKKFIVLFEEPELFLHPKLTRQLRKLVYDVSAEDKPFQVLCASHSPQMIDIAKPKTSLVRIVKSENHTRLFQIDEDVLLDRSTGLVKKELYEALRFNSFVCEAFYADEVILVEGDTEAVLIRAYFQINEPKKDIFVMNCGSVNNIPFFQKIFFKFNIKYHVICDTDGHFNGDYDDKNNPIMNSGYIQESIYKEFVSTYTIGEYETGLLRVHETNFETAHRAISDQVLRFPFEDDVIKSLGKPYCANRYWDEIINLNISAENINDVPIIKFLKEILS
jgi:predicted ATP-dependent endonuclease of OLD family